MHAILLCGGLGTRLSGLFPDIPKALVPVAGKPIIQRQIEWLKSLGVAHIHIAAGYKAEKIQRWFEATPSLHDTVSVSVEPEPLGTAGGIKYASAALSGNDHYLVLNGDSLLPGLTLAPLCGKLNETVSMNMAVTEIADTSRYGTVELADGAIASAFHEKTGDAKPGFVNAGIYYLTRSVVNSIPEGRACSIEKDIFPALAEKRKIQCVLFPPPLLDMGTPDGLKGMTEFLMNNSASA